jgi:hypothetical protein
MASIISKSSLDLTSLTKASHAAARTLFHTSLHNTIIRQSFHEAILTLSAVAGATMCGKIFSLPKAELTSILELGLLDPELRVVRVLRG